VDRGGDLLVVPAALIESVMLESERRELAAEIREVVENAIGCQLAQHLPRLLREELERFAEARPERGVAWTDHSSPTACLHSSMSRSEDEDIGDHEWTHRHMKCYLSDTGIDEEGNFKEDDGPEQHGQLFEGWGTSIRAGIQNVNKQVRHDVAGNSHVGNHLDQFHNSGQHSGVQVGQQSGDHGVTENAGTRSSSKDSRSTSKLSGVQAITPEPFNPTKATLELDEAQQLIAVQQPPGVVVNGAEINMGNQVRRASVAERNKAAQEEEEEEEEEQMQNSADPGYADMKKDRANTKSVKTVVGYANLGEVRNIFNRRGTTVANRVSTNMIHRASVRIVTHTWFDSIICVLIIANAVSIGVLTNYLATHSSKGNVPTPFRVVDGLFCTAFTVEIILKIYVYQKSFFIGPSWGWNLFDVGVVGLQLVEETGNLIVDGSDSVVPGANFSFVRTLRILRLIRILRLVRILRLISELRLLVMSILGSMRSLLWTVALLMLLIYTISLYITQLVADSRNEGHNPEDDHVVALRQYYGTVGDTMISMFQAISGGIDWRDLMTPLREKISLFTALVFLVYIAFSMLAMLNVVTGVFVESVMKSTVKDRNLFMISNARELFASIERDDNSDGPVAMTWGVFQSKMHSPQMQEFFKAIDVDPCEAKGLFHLLDLDGSGSLSADEFLNGCLRLRGEAKSLDVALLIQEVRRVRKMFEHYLDRSTRSSQRPRSANAHKPSYLAPSPVAP